MEQVSGPATSRDPYEKLAGYPLFEALIERRSRRFAAGMSMNGGPLAYGSARSPRPLSLEEEAALAFAACGVTGPSWRTCPTRTAASRRRGAGTS